MEDQIINEFLDKVDKLCYEYNCEILPNPDKLPGEYPTILIKRGDITHKILFIDGDASTKCPQLIFQPCIATSKMVNACHNRLSLGRKPRNNQCRRSTDIRRNN